MPARALWETSQLTGDFDRDSSLSGKAPESMESLALTASLRVMGSTAEAEVPASLGRVKPRPSDSVQSEGAPSIHCPCRCQDFTVPPPSHTGYQHFYCPEKTLANHAVSTNYLKPRRLQGGTNESCGKKPTSRTLGASAVVAKVSYATPITKQEGVRCSEQGKHCSGGAEK